jgi:hypothetical protein
MKGLRRTCWLGCLLLLGGCTAAAQLHFGDVTLGWHHIDNAIQTVGGHVAIGIH